MVALSSLFPALSCAIGVDSPWCCGSNTKPNITTQPHSRYPPETKLEWSLKKLHYADKSSSFASRADRLIILCGIAKVLNSGGYRGLHANGLKPKHVEAMVKHWKTKVSPRTGQTISTATIKYRMSVLRWWAKSVGKPNVVPRSNDSLGIPRRVYALNTFKAVQLQQSHLDRIRCPYIRAGLELQATFSLRREEALKIQPAVTDDVTPYAGNRVVQRGYCRTGDRGLDGSLIKVDIASTLLALLSGLPSQLLTSS